MAFGATPPMGQQKHASLHVGGSLDADIDVVFKQGDWSVYPRFKFRAKRHEMMIGLILSFTDWAFVLFAVMSPCVLKVNLWCT
eukprot:15350313-Ditylum_brightwellii.AAC.1